MWDFYSLTECEVPKDSWPPVGNSTFINLVIIQQKPVSTCDYYTIRGDMDDIIKSKEVAGYEEVFKDYREGALTLVEGRPGSGKTTLVHKITRDWATGKKVLQQAKMVFLVTLRLLNASEKDKSLLDLLRIFYGEDLSKHVEHELKESRGKGACFILDGLDEYPIESKKKLVVDELLFNKSFLPHSMVIVASRPVATRELKKVCKTHVEVVGFSRDQIYRYVRSFPFSDSFKSMACKMTEYLDQHPNVLHMCYLPVHAAMICFLFSQLEGNIPHRETQIYEQFTIATLLGHKVTEGIQCKIRFLKELSGRDQELFHSICKLAFDMLDESRLVVSESEARVKFPNSSLFGLLTVEGVSKYYGFENFYTFHHLTFQEFLAASYIVEAKMEINQLINRQKFYNVLKFYCGLAGSSNVESCKAILQQSYYDWRYKAQCACESQQVVLCDYTIKDDVIKFHNTFVSCTDFIALGYVLCNTTKPVTKLSIQNSWWDIEGVSSIYWLADKNHLQFLKILKVKEITDAFRYEYQISDKDAEALNGMLRCLPFFEELNLIEVTFNSSKIKCLTREVKLPHLKVLKITLLNEFCSNPEEIYKLLAFGSQHLEKVYFSLERSLSNAPLWRKIFRYAFNDQIDISLIYIYNSRTSFLSKAGIISKCTDVVLINCCIDDDEAKLLAYTINPSVLTKLVLDFNRISDSGAVAIANCLSKCRTVQEVSIECNSIGDSGATALANALINCISLRRLNLQGNSLGDEGAIAIAKATKNLPGLDQYLHNVNITENGIEKILEQRADTNVRSMVLSISWYSIRDADLNTLRNALYCGTMPKLELSSANIHNFEKFIESGELKSVRALDIDVKDEDVPSLCRIIDGLTSLSYVKCYMNDIKSNVQLMSDSLESCKSLNKFHVVNSDYNSVLNMIKKRNNLQSLALTCCFQKERTESCFTMLNQKSASYLQNLTFERIDLGLFDAVILGRYLLHCKNLCQLNLSHSGTFGDIVAGALAEGLKHHTGLKELYLGFNFITFCGMTALVPVMKRNSLRTIDFSGNLISPGAIALVYGAMHTDALQYLSLSFTELGQHVFDITSLSGLKYYTRLTSLNIRHNFIGSHILPYLAEGLQYCTNLQELYLDLNLIDADGVPAVIVIMKSCKYLCYLGLSGNKIGIDGAAVLVGGWIHRSPLYVNLGDCFDEHHRYALLNVKKCCHHCDNLLELYYKNDYIYIDIDHRSIPSL